MHVTSPFSAELRDVFDHAIDFIALPDRLEGRWGDDWQRETNLRVQHSDLIARVRVETILSDQDPEQRVSYRLVARLDGDPMFGEAPEDGRVELEVHEGDEGFATVRDNERRLAQEPHLVFIKWYENELRDIAAHWHMSPYSPRVRARVLRLIELRSGEAPEDRGQLVSDTQSHD